MPAWIIPTLGGLADIFGKVWGTTHPDKSQMYLPSQMGQQLNGMYKAPQPTLFPTWATVLIAVLGGAIILKAVK